MKIVLKLKGNLYSFMRQCGYSYQGIDQKTGAQAFIRRIGGSDYPRFHIFAIQNEKIALDLHLDQKKPIYKGAPAHAAEYSGKVVEKEAERIRNVERMFNVPRKIGGL